MIQDLLGVRARTLRTVVRAVTPGLPRLDERAWEEARAVVNTALADRDPKMLRQLRLFLLVLEEGARIFHGHSLSHLNDAQVGAYLERFERSPVPVLRKGFWGVRTLALMAYYARPEGAASVGYRADARGWSAREVLP